MGSLTVDADTIDGCDDRGSASESSEGDEGNELGNHRGQRVCRGRKRRGTLGRTTIKVARKSALHSEGIEAPSARRDQASRICRRVRFSSQSQQRDAHGNGRPCDPSLFFVHLSQPGQRLRCVWRSVSWSFDYTRAGQRSLGNGHGRLAEHGGLTSHDGAREHGGNSV
jgi:hypothetical protein